MARKEAVYTVKLDAGQATKSVDQLNKEFEELENTIGVEVSSSISLMEDKLYDLALAGEQNTKEFKDLQKQVAQYKQIVIETDRSIDQLAEQGRGLSTALSLAEGTVAGFQAFTGVTALLGTENEELLETITKLQAAQGVLNSIQIIRQQLQENAIKLTQLQAGAQRLLTNATSGSTKAMKAFKIALLATGIGALIVGISALVANWDKLKESILGNTDAQDAYNDTIGDYKKGASDAVKQTKEVETAFNLARDGVISKEEALKTYNTQLGDTFGTAKDLNEAEKLYREKTDAYIEATALRAQANALLEKASEEQVNALTAELEDQTSIVDKAGAGLTAYFFGADQGAKDLQKSQKQAVEETKKSAKDREELFSNMAEDLLKQAKDIEDSNGIVGDSNNDNHNDWKKQQEERQRIIEDQFKLQEEIRRMRLSAEELEEIAIADKYDALFERAKGNAELEAQLIEQQTIELNNLYAKREAERQKIEDEARKIAEAKRNEDLDRIAQAEEAFLVQGKDREINAVTDKYFELIELAKQNGQDTAILEDAQQAELDAIETKWREKREADDEAEKQKKIQRFNEYAQTVQNGLGALNDLNTLVADIQLKRAEGDQRKQEQIQLRAFKIGKALQLSLATVQGIQAVQNAYTTALASPITAVNPAYPFIQAGIAGATSAINIAKIASTQFQGGGGSTSISPPTGGTGAGASSFSIGDNTSSEQTFLDEQGNQVGGNKPQKVFVTETDISNTQNDVNAIDVKSTF